MIWVLVSTNQDIKFGDRGLLILATLLYLSYVKFKCEPSQMVWGLLSTMIMLLILVQSRSEIVWSLDGNLLYGRFPHIFHNIIVKVCPRMHMRTFYVHLFSHSSDDSYTFKLLPEAII